MPSEYAIYAGNGTEMSLLEYDGTFEVIMSAARTVSTKTLTADEVVQIAAGILGPMLSHCDGDEVMDRFLAILKERGFIP